MDFRGKNGLKVNGNNVWHEGNFDPASKANSSHTHTKANITDFPTSLPANGGNADTVGGKRPEDFTLQSYTDSNIYPVNNVAMVNLGRPTVTEMALIDSQATNKIWFHPIDKMIFEESDDGIAFNERSDISDTDKRRLVSGNSNASISIPKGKYFRITIFPRSYVYLNWIYMYFSTTGDRARFKCEKKRDDGDWITHFDYTNSVSGWPGHIFIPHSTIAFSPNSTSGHYNQVRITIATDEQTNTYPNMTLYGLEWWGGYPRGSRDIFSYDEYQNVTFPEELKAKTFKNASGKEVAYQNDIPVKLSELNKDINFDERYYTKSETYTKTEVNTKLDGKVDNSRVLTDVPVNAKFTDTITTINSKTGAISKTDIVALGIPAQDTVYIHPATHPASMITESTTRRFVSDAEKTAWNGKQDALGYTPENLANKNKANGYAGTDSNNKIPLSLLPDISMNKTFIVNTIAERDALTGIKTADRVYVLDAGDGSREGFIWDGTQWLKDSDTDWANVSLEWANINGKPASSPVNIDDAVNKKHSHTNKNILDTFTQPLVNSWNSAFSHVSDTIKHITNTERDKWNTIDSKVDKISGKGLSTEDYTTAEKDKLANIEANANNYALPIATNAILGGIKVGSNLSITEDGTLSANSNPDNYIIKEEEFVTNASQTTFILTKGSYIPNKNMVDVYVYGQKQPKDLFIETNSTTITSKLPFEEGIRIIIKYIQSINATPYPVHGDMHLTGGDDPIPLATTLQDGLMAKEDKTKVHNHNNKTLLDTYTQTEANLADAVAKKHNHSGNDTTHYHNSDRDRSNHTGTQLSSTISNFASTVRNTVLTGLSTTTNAVISATDSILSALGKLQKQISDNLTMTQTALNGKVDNSRVLTDVPANAKFTDTITTINGKTGAIAKADIVALGIPAQDTIYTHPTTHPASMITESSTKRFVSDAEKTAWNGKQNALGYTPVNKAGDSMTGTLVVDGKNLPSGADIVTMKRGSGTTNRFVLETQDKAMQAFMEAGAAIGLMGTITASDFRIRTNYTDRVSIRGSDGNVGIGTTSPTQTLDVNGKIRMRTQTAAADGDDIVATKKYVDDGLDNKVDNSRVLTDVPANAKFTDTVYSHPPTHPASIITESTTKRFVSDTEKTNWNNKAEVSDIPTKVGQLQNDKNYVTQSDLGEAGLGDMVKCYNVDTDILTDRGFINITQLNKQDKVATLNPSNDEIVYQPVKNIYKYNNIDKLYEISNQQIDLSVTLNHKMYIRKRNKDSFELVEAKDIMGKRVEYKKYGIWKGDYKPYVEIEDVKIPIEIYAEFMGYYLSEGCTINAINGQGVKDYLICITQVKSKTKEKMLKTTEQVAFLFGRNAFVNNGKNIKISDKRLYNHLHPFGKSYEKYIPDVIMNSTQEIIRIFLEAYVDGDGNRKNDCNRKTEQWSIFTTSKKMADQLQELALKAGWSANISEINKIGDINYINGRKVISRHTCYRIGFNKKKNTPMVNHGHVKKQNAQSEGIVKYGGNVIGVEVAKYHTLYVRRNGKAVWSGNSTYDTNNNGIVDNAEKVNGFTVEANVPANAKFTDTIYTHPSTHPVSMITGLHNVATSGIADKLSIVDTRSVDSPPSYYFGLGKNMFWEFKYRSSVGNPPTNASASGTYAFILTITGWADSSGGYPVQVSVGGSNLAIRQGTSTSAWGPWYVIANISDLPIKLSQLTKDINFDERYYTETEMDTKLNGKANISHTHTANDLPNGTTSAKGIVQLSTSTSSTSTTLAATASAVKQAYDLANSKTKIVKSATQPTGLSVGDVWIQTI